MKISKIMFKSSWLLFCLGIVFLDYLIVSYETSTIVLCIALYYLIVICIYAMSCTVSKAEEDRQEIERYKKLIGRLKIKSFVYEDAETNSLYIENADLPEIIDYLYELQTLGGLVNEKDN